MKSIEKAHAISRLGGRFEEQFYARHRRQSRREDKGAEAIEHVPADFTENELRAEKNK